MVKKYSLHLDALIVIFLLFLASVLGNIFLAQAISSSGKKLIDTQAQLVLTQLNLRSRNKEFAQCQNQLDEKLPHITYNNGLDP